jgi:AcrR family transcriptional regulator
MRKKPKELPERRVPTQERSKKRVEAMLDAAAALFGELGFDATSIEAIAEKAETSVGSVYQFFPNKRAVFEALAARCLERMREALDALLAAHEDRPWSEVIDTVIDALAMLREADPAYRALLVNFQLYGIFEQADVALTRYVIERVQALVRKHAPRVEPAKRKIVATTIVNTIQGSLFLSQREPPAVTMKLLAETKAMLRRYFEPYTLGDDAAS